MVTAFEYERSFRRLLDPRSKTAAIELLMNLKNAAKIRAEGLSSEKLGVTALNARTLVFEFDRPDPDFLFKLAATVLVPVRSEAFPIREGNVGFLSNGPYKIAGWRKGRRILLEANSHYPFGAKDRPPVEVLFVDAAETALNLYQKRILTFLRSLPTHHMAKYETRPDFHNVPMSRFDYIGFGDELRDQPDLRAALSLSADYEELRKLLRALGRPGCPGLPGTMLDRPSCLAFDLKKAKSHLSRVAKKARQRRYRLAYSHLGGDDHKRVAEWFQYQWKKNLGIQVDIESTENAVFLHRLKTAPPPLFRKGLSLDRPTCLAALETFSRNGVENFLRLNDAKYEDLLAKLAAATEKDRNIRHGNQPDLPASAVKRACGDGIRHLLARHLLIPLGRIHFSILADPRFPGWTLNELNQLDLSNLRFDPGSKSGSESPH